ncbi:uncharacterized protein THITE_124386 [Thermothielavioides terrestris NRRL 8126]|uniref:Uncharacterized protein n=1 Tax=Thermothielavioides terrestris (strain ATCC 38088 / NRRL 8126) TaxID=578455 RepID=G2RHT9_THETT|nr:uncharacterized protein THITE_124386 [Thermothielavioides terrestris NRRL 8126]AEO71401.1 hypothetical protein THITE_124386 [Thermothielavioides terrestris NRRL 8126]
MRAWLVAKAEEDKRRQEEERTRQESYRLEQRKTEHEILRTSLQGGIPPPLVPVVFAGLGGGALSPAALEWAQQFMMPQSPQPHPPALMPSGAASSEQQRRDSHAQSFGQYPLSVGVPSTPGSAQGPPAAYMSGYPGSPTRPRGQSMPGAMAGRSHPGSGSNLPNLNINVQGGPGGTSGVVGHQPGMAQPQQQQQEQQASPSIYFHHWQPPTTQAGGRGGTDQPATPSVGESPRKRKAPGPQQPAPPPTTTLTGQRHRSPPFSHSTGLSNPPPGRRRGHARQRSDLESYRAGGRGRGDSTGPGREMSPMHTSGASSARDSGEPSSSAPPQQPQVPPPAPPAAQAPSARTGAHSVSSLLSDTPQSPRATTTRFAPPGTTPAEPTVHHQHHHHHHQHQHHQQQPQEQYGKTVRRSSPLSSEE